jgi:hypothetical protein
MMLTNKNTQALIEKIDQKLVFGPHSQNSLQVVEEPRVDCTEQGEVCALPEQDILLFVIATKRQ